MGATYGDLEMTPEIRFDTIKLNGIYFVEI